MVITKKAVESDYYKEKIQWLLNNLNIWYKNITNYILAFIHKSIVNERPDFAPEHNERLEYLGDAVLELVITDALFKEFPNKDEWELTDIRSAIVRWTNLSKVARKLNFSEYLILGKWEEKTGWRSNDYILANTVEAFIWALYLDLGFTEVQKFILKNIYITLQDILQQNLTKDYKTIFQELSQAKFDITPHYEILEETWPDHNKNFKVGAFIWEKIYGKWNWTSKKKAQEQAAKEAYLKLINK